MQQRPGISKASSAGMGFREGSIAISMCTTNDEGDCVDWMVAGDEGRCDPHL